jgi:hypothetical protein
MLRAAALRALSTRNATAADATARKALDDAYPRVRSDALSVLAKGSDAIEVLSSSARKDLWFSVRVAALDNLPAKLADVTPLTAAVGDRSSPVRAAAIRALRRQHAASAWPVIAPHVADGTEYPEVIAEGIGFAKALCVTQAATELRDVVTRGLKPDAFPPDVDLALSALDALITLGGEHAAWAVARSNVPMVPEPMRREMQRLAKAGAACVATE